MSLEEAQAQSLLIELDCAAGSAPFAPDADWTEELFARAAKAIRAAFELWEYQVADSNGDMWAWTDTLEDAQHYLAMEPGGHIERRRVGAWERLEDAS